MTIVFSILIGAVAGFVAGALVFRNNADKINADIAKAQNTVSNVAKDLKK